MEDSRAWSAPDHAALRQLLRLPLALQALAAWLGACGAYLIDRNGCRSSLPPLLRQALGLSRWRAHLLALQVTLNAFYYLLDSAGVWMGPRRRLQRRARDCRFEGVAQLREALRGGRGVLLAASFHACFYFALLTRFAPADADLDRLPMHLVLPRRDPLLMALCARIADELDGRRCQFIVMGEPLAAVQMARALRRGEMVLCMVDNVPEGAAVSVAPLFGQPTLLPAGFLLMAARSGTPVLSCRTLREGHGFVTRLGAPLWPQPGLEPAEAATQLAQQLASQLEHNVRQQPAGWNSWLSLGRHWQMASALLTEGDHQ